MYTIYIPSLSRFDSALTMKALDKMGIAYKIIVEPQEVREYTKLFGQDKVLELDLEFKKNYNTLDDLGQSKSVGPGAARNFAWEHSIAMGDEYHWVMDDNIRNFLLFNNNKMYIYQKNDFFERMEEPSVSFNNVAMSGPNYFMFIARKMKYPVFVRNTRIYSCNFIKNSIPFRWRGRYNEDTILSLDILQSGMSTVRYNMFLQDKTTTQHIKGGNTEVFYSKEGTTPKSEMLYKIYPDVTRLVIKYGREHHHVNYKPYHKNPLMKGIKND